MRQSTHKPSSYSSEKAVRLEARLSRSQKELIQHAADLLGRSLTDFVISSTQDAAQKIIREHEVLSLTAKESERFVEALLATEPNAKLKRAAKAYDKFIEDKD